MNVLEELKTKKQITRDDIERLLADIGKPGIKHQEKLDAVKELNIKGGNGVGLEQTLDSYRSF